MAKVADPGLLTNRIMFDIFAQKKVNGILADRFSVIILQINKYSYLRLIVHGECLPDLPL